MYLQQLNAWSDDKWANKLRPFSLTQEEEFEVKQILTMPTKQGVESGFSRLYEFGIINGIGANWQSKYTRGFLTWIYPDFRWEFHDLDGLLGGSPEDRKKSDLGMLKYTTKSIGTTTSRRIDSGVVFCISYDLFISVPLKYLFAFIFYLFVRFFGVFGSFDFDEEYHELVFLEIFIKVMVLLLIITTLGALYW